MNPEAIAFWVLGTIAVIGALGVVAAPKAVYSALWLATTMIALAIIYVAEEALFLGVVQIVGRTVFDFAIHGYIDWIEQSSSLFAFLGIAYAQRLGSHIRMDITLGWPTWVRWWIELHEAGGALAAEEVGDLDGGDLHDAVLLEHVPRLHAGRGPVGRGEEAAEALGLGAAVGAGKLRRFGRGPVRIGLANLAGPRSAARTAAPAIGLGAALLAAVVLIQSSLLAQVSEAAPQSAPAMVFMEVPGDRGPEFDATVSAAFGEPLTRANYQRFPYLSGRVLSVRGANLRRGDVEGRGRRLVDNDLAMSAVGPQPQNAQIIAGKWWPADYAGPPLVSIDDEVAKGAGVKLGDPLVIEVLGAQIEARVASLRKVEFGGFGANFSMVLNPGSLEGAVLRNIAIAKMDRAAEARLTSALEAEAAALLAAGGRGVAGTRWR